MSIHMSIHTPISMLAVQSMSTRIRIHTHMSMYMSMAIQPITAIHIQRMSLKDTTINNLIVQTSLKDCLKLSSLFFCDLISPLTGY